MAAAGNKNKRWKENVQKFLSLESLFDQKSRTDVNVILDQLNAEEFSSNLVTDQTDIVEFFTKGCSLIAVDKSNSFLLSKFFHLVEKILLKQKIILHDRTLNNLIKHVTISARICPGISVYDHLKVLAELLYENGGKCSKYYEDLLGVEPTGLLLEYTDRKNADIETQKAAITCIGNICAKDINGSYIDERYGEIGLLAVLNVLQTPPRRDVIKIEHCKLINTSLKAIQEILPSVKSQLKRHLGQLLLTIKNYIFYGFPGYEPTFPNRASDSSPRDSSSDLEPDDLSILKLSLAPVKERTFPGRGALKKKSRQKRGKRQKEDKNEDDDIFPKKNDFTCQDAQSYKNPGQLSVSRRFREKEGEEETANVAMATNTVRSWREREPDQQVQSGDFDNTTWSSFSSSESEFSDSESGQARRLRSAATKVRNSALTCLQTVIKNSEKKELFGFWSSFISDGSGALTFSLFTIIQSDPNFKNRTGAAAVLIDLLDGSKPFLAAADDSQLHQTSSTRPFTPFSSRLGSIIHELHRLLDIIPTETSSSTQVQLIKCMAMLVLNCPYHKLQTGLLSKVVDTIRPLLSGNDLHIKQSALVCLGAVLTVNAPLSEVMTSMEEITLTQSETSMETENNTTLSHEDTGTLTQSYECLFPWLVHECLQILSCSELTSQDADSKDLLTNVRCETLNLLIVFARNYFNLLRPVASYLADVTHECLKERNPLLQVNAIKLLQELGRMMYQNIYTEDNDDEKKLVQEFWLKLLNGEVVKVLQSVDPLNNKCKAAACDCLSDIGAKVLEELPFDKRIMIMTILLGLSNDDDCYVKAASVRALGVYIVYPFLRENVLFVTDAANAITSALNDATLLVRIRGAWSLANLSDALVMNKNSKGSTFIDDFSETLLLRLINVALTASEDNEKVKCNVVRSLGNFGKYLSEANVEKKTFSEAIDNILGVLTKCIQAGLMKTRWNACYAAGNVFSNHALATGKTKASVQMFDALLSVVGNCKNFKVRINAVNALAVPCSRSCYGDEKQFFKLWSCLVETLIGTQEISDFSEFKYRDTLREQISATICHISNLISPTDVEILTPIVSTHQEDLTHHLTVYYQNQLKLDNNPTKSSQLQVTDNPAELFLGAHRHILTIKQDFAGSIQAVFDEAKQNAEEHVKSLFEHSEETTQTAARTGKT